VAFNDKENTGVVKEIMGGTVIRFKNKSKNVNRIGRKWHNAKDRIDIEDPYYVGKKGTYECDICGSSMIPYKQDALGDIIVTCCNPCCLKHKDNANSITVKLAKLLKQQQAISNRFYMDYNGSYK